MRGLVVFAQALADDTRWRLLRLVFDDALCVCELADILAMPQSSVSSHLQVIRKAGLLESERCGKWVYYRVAPGHRGLLVALSDRFQASPARDRTLRSDAKRSAKRLAEREASCCPLPKRLARTGGGSTKKGASGS